MTVMSSSKASTAKAVKVTLVKSPIGYNQRQMTDKHGPFVTSEQAEARYKVNALGFASSANLTGRVNVGFKYFQEFMNRSTFQGHSIQISGLIKF